MKKKKIIKENERLRGCIANLENIIGKKEKQIEELKRGVDRDLAEAMVTLADGMKNTSNSESMEDGLELIRELEDRHQQDCIEINKLHVTIDTLVDSYAKLRQIHGL